MLWSAVPEDKLLAGMLPHASQQTLPLPWAWKTGLKTNRKLTKYESQAYGHLGVRCVTPAGRNGSLPDFFLM